MVKYVIISAARTAVGSYLGSLKTVSPDQLAAVVIEEAVMRSNLKLNQVERVIMGNVFI